MANGIVILNVLESDDDVSNQQGATNAPILLLTGDKVTGQQQYQCIAPKAVYTVKKRS